MLASLYLVLIPTGMADSTAEGYSDKIKMDDVYIYNVSQFGGDAEWYNFTPWPADSLEGYWRTNSGGQIQVNLTGYYDKDPNDWGNVFVNPIPYMDVEIFENQSNTLVSNFTITNRSNSEVARQLNLGFNDFQSGFLIPADNWIDVRAKAEQEKTGEYANAELTIRESNLTINIIFNQTDGVQYSSMVYDKISGLLLWTYTEFGVYCLEMKIKGYSLWEYPVLSNPIEDEEEDKKDGNSSDDLDIPTYSFPIIVGILSFGTLIGILNKKRKLKNL